tara:strand:+ start:70 stop:753 length:684 start_codon:yes stop_codon:yes gene_type:complete
MSTPLHILYQDEWLVAVDKPAGQLVHPSDTPSIDDEVTMKILRDQIGQQVHVIHRLDRPTSGVLLFATDLEAARGLHSLFENHEVEKIYWAVADGHPAEPAWVSRQPLIKEPSSKEQSAETEFRVLEAFPNDLALIEAKPKSGRYHQIRRHLLHAGHPIVGDYRYAGVERSDEMGQVLGTGTRMLLQAKSLQFQHPMTKGNTLIEAVIDPALQNAINHSRSHRRPVD